MGQAGKQTWTFTKPVYIQSTGTVVGPLEGAGPLHNLFDYSYDDLHCGETNWELAERRLMSDAVHYCLQKAGIDQTSIDLLLTGDLLNQNVTGNYVARQLGIPLLGMFGACSTSMETLATGAALIEAGYAKQAIAAVSSHNATAERQYRYPTEYGGQKPKTATFTVTGSGAALLSTQPSPIRVEAATIGRVVDYGTNDPFDLGSAMVPAAWSTIKAHFEDMGRVPSDYDVIATGDLSSVGTPILRDMLKNDGYDVADVHDDCGLMVYHSDQPVFSGGSGCACSAVVTYGKLIDDLKQGKYKRILVVATGALMNPMMIQQKETIPCIAHGVVLTKEDN
ncbi:stage V sporulation protein AD [Halobacillus shinanisalinarum]|uniref:Stage V sporulation protein AD n=1 Tax=Halobacillus shinanisalinarum TaxID=2932258 RepID=A0ABY4GZL4_9BACI|nr:stage V sporulation protein AD [Halobacillus shinanisalinarum]UOQ93640.1 stage V sporulation protein AD [Halobacillus shinanisalinarum]